MKRIAVVMLCCLMTVGSLMAKEDKSGYQDCILTHVSGVEESLAASLMTYACHRLYR